MLDVLHDVTAERALAVIRAAASLIYPSGMAEVKPSTGVDANLVSSVVVEVARRTKTPANATTEKERYYQLRYLSKEMSRIFIPENRIQAVVESLGQRGKLRPDRYKIDFDAKDKLTNFEVSRGVLVNSISQAQTWMHTDPEGTSAPDAEPLSIFARTYQDSKNRATHTHVTVAVRQNDHLSRPMLFRLYHDDVNVEEAEDPLDLLISFVNAFGIEFSVAGSERTKFLYFHQKTLARERFADTMFSPQIFPDKPAGEGRFCVYMKVDEPSGESGKVILNIALGFCIDAVAYVNSLRKHGVHR